MTKIFAAAAWVLMICSISVAGQTRERRSGSGTNNFTRNCRVFLNGRLLNNPKPVYPNEAKTAGISGKVEIAVEIDTFGNVAGIESTNGHAILVRAASEAARQAVFSPTLCDGKATRTIGVITYNFAPVELIRELFKPSAIEDFTDISSKDNHYEAVLFLTENYRIAFGYADQKFHAEMPLTYGDFAHFLRQMMEMLDSRGKLARKIPQEIGLYQPFNPHAHKEVEVNPTAPYAHSVKILSQKYKIVLADRSGSFDAEALPGKKEIIGFWRAVFGPDTVPINFLEAADEQTSMSRGEFAVYLKETLDILTYKILP
jgi:TonB family protein